MCHCECECDHGNFKTKQNTSEKKLTVQVSFWIFIDFDTDSNGHPINNGKATAETGEFGTTLKCALRISGIAVVSSIAIPETVSLSSLQFQVSHNTNYIYRSMKSSVVRYSRYLDTYRRYLRDDTSIAKVTIYRGIS